MADAPNGWSFLDYNSYFSTGYSTGDTSNYSTEKAHITFNVALILDRATDPSTGQPADPTTLLNSSWGDRQQQLATLNDNGSLWSVYGASDSGWQTVNSYLADNGFSTVEQLANQDPSRPSGYVTGEAAQNSRTIWVHLDEAGFNSLFGQELLLVSADDPNGNMWWEGNLSLPTEIAGLVKGLWFDIGAFGTVEVDAPATADYPALPQGTQGQGNGATEITYTPQAVAEAYNFPLAGRTDVETDPIGILEPQLGNTSPDPGESFEELLGGYRQQIGLSPEVTVTGVQPGGTTNDSTDLASGERSLDVGIATAVNPNSTIVLYAGAGVNWDARSHTFSAHQAAVFDPNHPSVVSSSYGYETTLPSPNSPWLWAANQLFMDAALANMSIFNAAGDGGSSYEIANGLNNGGNSYNSPYTIAVGGTSLSMVEHAAHDPSLRGEPSTFQDFYHQALDQDKATLWQLVQGGMTTMPVEGASTWFVETVWNAYHVTVDVIEPGYSENEAGSGGVNFVQPEPWYQTATLPFDPPTSSDGSGVTGRGVPDVAALSGGNMHYEVPTGDMDGITGAGGTSASAPFWASLIVQVNAILEDQGIPYDLGYMNDLLYMAAAIAPASFNDVTIGNNNSSHFLVDEDDEPDPSQIYHSAYKGEDGQTEYTEVVPTSYGYSAAPGYDLASGLGSPNGVLLARTLSAITHAQLFSDTPNVLDADGSGGWTSAVDQSLSVQVVAAQSLAINLESDGMSVDFTSVGVSPYGWSNSLAGQSLQSDFDASLITLFDGDSQGTIGQGTLAAGAGLSVTINGDAATPYSEAFTNAFGFVDFQTESGTVRVARPVSVAETAGGADDTTAIVRLRQNGQDSLSVLFYKVDDYTGTITNSDGTFQPGSAGYADAALGAAYQLEGGGTWLNGPGFGQFLEADLLNVDAGDIIAMELHNNTHDTTFWAFSQANESVDSAPMAHLWNYGLNLFGWEDTLGGGDRDYNDLIVGLDFTSAAGNGYLR